MSTEGRVVLELQGITKHHLAHVWEKMRAGEQLAGAEIYIGRSMADHPQWFPFFSTIGLLETGDDELPDGQNPFAHVSMHILVGSQIFSRSPEEAETFFRLRVRKGDEPHAVIHMMIEVFQRHLAWAVEHRGASGEIQFDQAAYGRTLRSLMHEKTRRLWAKLGHSEIPVPHDEERPRR
jgi:hypothetical protein